MAKKKKEGKYLQLISPQTHCHIIKKTGYKSRTRQNIDKQFTEIIKRTLNILKNAQLYSQ